MITQLMTTYPKESVVIISFLITLITTLITKKYTNQNRMKELKQIQKACQIKLKDSAGNPAKMAEIQKEMMACSMELLKHSFRPMIFTMIPLLILFWWIRGVYSPILSGWLWWYLGAGILSSLILRKLLKVA